MQTTPLLTEFNSPKLTRLILKLAIPSVIGLSAHALHQIVNAFFVGRLGTEAVSAVSLCFPILIFLAALGEGAGVGVAACISRLLGAHQPERAHQIATTVMVLLAVFSMGLAFLFLPLLPTILNTIGATPYSLEMSVTYTRIVLLCAPLMLLQILCDFIAIAEGNSRFSMWTLIGSFALNIVLDPFFIFTLNLGVAGAAWATAVSGAAALIAYVIYFQRRWGIIRIAWRYYQINTELLWQVISVGVPAALSTGLAAFAYAVLYHTATRHGDAAIAAIGIGFRILAVGTLPVVGFCLGAQALLGYSWGAHNLQRFRQTVYRMLSLTSLFTLSYACLIITYAPSIVSWFTQDKAVLPLAIFACRMFHLGFAFFGLHMVAVVALQAAGRSSHAALLVLAPQGYLLIPALLVLPDHWGFTGLVSSPALATGLGVFLAGILLFREIKKSKEYGQASYTITQNWGFTDR